MAIETPCNKVCAVDPISALCVGCGRTLGEIESWLRLSPDERAHIMAELPQRLARISDHPPTSQSRAERTDFR
jgi:predicted Fe-S protein YdhL (DUF1289 family)